MRNIVVAYDEHYGIGADNDLLWQRDLPSDLRHFRELTLGQAVIMGHKTFESIGRPLPGRQNIVVTRQDIAVDDVDVVHDIDAAFAVVESGK
ncbi:MAG TPA: dihydrofolate reductase, partial [Candidatus Saccharimonadaceae bacterium]|nr:dihydrofolate reductase [Candidatus Saccharimonadaceae bacterium]